MAGAMLRGRGLVRVQVDDVKVLRDHIPARGPCLVGDGLTSERKVVPTATPGLAMGEGFRIQERKALGALFASPWICL